ncbi:MAG: GNAT family N-acetyltransferase [Pseudomonadota bacterium]|nr:GNAT family N-acetyltransferase [Pseudomonadota bacterium]
MNVRPINAADIPDVLPLVEQYWIFEDIAGYDESRIGRELLRLCEDPRLGAGWIAEEKGRPVGYLLAVFIFSLEHLGLTAEIDEFFLLPSARGHGAGSALLAAAEAEATRRDCRNISLQLARGNEAARDFYRRQGYSERSGFELLDKMLPQ